MTSTAPQREGLFEESLRQGQIRHALKTALACCLATALTYFFHLAAGEFAPIFVVIIMALGMPSPRLNAILGQFAIAVSAVVSALLVIAFHDVPFLFLSVTLVWIFTCLLFTSRFPLPGSMGSMVSAIGIFVFSQGTVGETLAFYVAYGIDWFVGGFSVIVVNTLIWPRTTEKVFLERLAAVYAHLEEQCRRVARQIRSGESSPVEASAEEWAPFRPLRQMLAPELRRGRDTSNPFARMILACRALNLRLRLFNQAVAPVLPAALPVETRQQLAGLVDRCAEHLHAVLEGILHGNQVSPLDAGLLQRVLLAHGTPQTVLRRVLQDLQTVTTSQNALLPSLRKGLAGELVALEPLATGTRLIDVNSLREHEAGSHYPLVSGGTTGAWFSRGDAGRLFCDVLCEHRQPRPADQDRLAWPVRPPKRLRLRSCGGLLHQPSAPLPPPVVASVPGRVSGQSGLSKTAALQHRRPAGRHGAALRLPGDHRSGVGLVRGGADAHCGDSRRWLHGDGRSRLSLAGAAHASAARVRSPPPCRTRR